MAHEEIHCRGEPCAQPCVDCAVRPHAICAALDQDELRDFKQLGYRLQYRPNESVFTQEEIATSCYNVLEGVMRLYKLLPDGRRQIVGFALPGDFLGLYASERYAISIGTLRDWIAKGRLPALRIGPRLLRVDLNDLEKLCRPVPSAPRFAERDEAVS